MDEFIVKLADILQTAAKLTPETRLDSLDEYDSLARMSILAFMDQDYGIKLVFNDFKELKTVSDLAKKADL
jgi:acyl carrier protein